MSLNLSWRWSITSNKLSALHYCIRILSEVPLHGLHFTHVEHSFWNSIAISVKTVLVKKTYAFTAGCCVFYGYLQSLINWTINSDVFFHIPASAKLRLVTFSKHIKGCIELIFFCMYDFTRFSVNVTWADLGQLCVNLLYWKWISRSLNSESWWEHIYHTEAFNTFFKKPLTLV